jgi:hypothetical protein
VTTATALGLAGGALELGGMVPYIRDTLRGATRPHRASWVIWGVLATVVFASQWADGATWSLALVGAQFIATTVVIALSVRRGEGGGTLVDAGLLALAGLGVVSWQVAGDPTIATISVTFADVIGVALMLPKAYRDPASETASTYLLGGAAGALSALSVGSLDFALILYPAYIAVAGTSIGTLIWLRRRTLARAAPGIP